MIDDSIAHSDESELLELILGNTYEACSYDEQA